MKKVNVKYYVKSFKQFEEEFQQILSVFYDKTISHLEINLVMDMLDNMEIEKIVNCINEQQTFKDISNNIIYTFIVTMRASQKPPKNFSKIKGLLSRIDLVSSDKDFRRINETFVLLKKRKLPCALLIRDADFNRIIDIYRRSATLGVPIFVENEMCFDDKFSSLFEEWVYDKNGCRINIFADVLSRILLDYWGTKCQYKSCLTKNFLIDADGSIYSCKKRENWICNLRDISSINDILSHENFILILKRSITKRAQCKVSCEFYELCQGGCPIYFGEVADECRDRQLFFAIESINEQFKSIINNLDYRDLNPAVREMILSSAASNKLFEKEMIV